MKKNNLNDTVIKNGFCIGCGICTAIDKSPYKIISNKYGMYQAQKSEEEKTEPDILMEICPFSSNINENNISKKIFDTENSKYNDKIGYYQELKVGHVISDDYRLSSTSGGLVSWTIEKLFEQDLIDAVIHVKRSNNKELLFEYAISETPQEALDGKKSRYYPIELSKILKQIKGDNKRYAVVGIPCFIKGLRLLKTKNKQYDNLKFFIGIICGQLKSKYFANLFAFPYGIKPTELTDIDFRSKNPEANASEYFVTLKAIKNGNIKIISTKPAKEMFGSDWGMGMLKYEACDVCDDVFNETADIVFGDAWVAPYNKDWKGTNLVIIRNQIFHTILNTSKENIFLENISEKDTLFTQNPNVRHRIDNLGYRLYLFKKSKKWIPEKRKLPSNDFSRKIKRIQRLRLTISTKSHSAMEIANSLNSFWIFKFIMKPYVLIYNFERSGLKSLIPVHIKKFMKSLIKKQ